MDTKKKKEILMAYKERHPEMGVISFRCSATDEEFLTTATDIPAAFRRKLPEQTSAKAMVRIRGKCFYAPSRKVSGIR